jgi:hypothetical protein
MTSTKIDWEAADQAAQSLGLITRQHVADRDPEVAIAWALQMSREHAGITSLSFYELAVMLGHRDPKVVAGAPLEWRQLLRSVEEIAATVKVKIAEAEKTAASDAAAERSAA